jgi:hypothetical protein
MSYRDRERFENSRPDQYGQEHYGRRQYGQSHDQQRGWDQQQHGWQPSEHQRGGDWRGREPNDWHRRESGAPRDNHPLSQEPFGHEPFAHSAFGESEQPRYFGTGAQGYGGGPSFTGGTYGTADWRSDAPYFDEVGFNRGNYEDPLPRQTEGRSQNRHGGYGQSGYGQSAYRQGRQQRRYPLGPKGYTRSDERLREDISERLMQAYDIDSSEVTVQVVGGKAVLEGTVPSRYMKHAIEDIADAAPGVQDVDNRIRVIGGSRWSTSADAGSVATNANNPVAGGTPNQGLGGTASTGRMSTTGGRRDS